MSYGEYQHCHPYYYIQSQSISVVFVVVVVDTACIPVVSMLWLAIIGCLQCIV